MPSFTCQVCSSAFELSADVLARFPGWTPKTCMGCKKGARKGRKGGRGAREAAPTRDAAARPASEALGELQALPVLRKVLETYQSGPQEGVFTDGSASPNPGAGGWGAVWVKDGVAVAQANGAVPDTTNNRMELQALISAFSLVPTGEAVTFYSDSDLCVKTITTWAAGWEKRGWKRKSGPIKNLDLVQELFALSRARPEVTFTWLRAHAGNRWNEYADALAGLR